MFKKIITALLLFTFVLNTAGCSGAWRRKFIRKKKEGRKEEPVLQPTDYKKEFTNRQLYANYFAFWKNSESELIKSVKGKRGQKRIKTYASYSEKEIMKLYDLLIEEKQKEFKPLIDEFKELISKVMRANYLNSNRNMLVRALKKHHRNVGRNFSFYKMKKHVKPDEEEAEELVQQEAVVTEGLQPVEVIQETEKAPEPEEPAYETAGDEKTLEGVTDFDISELNTVLEKYDIEPYKPGEEQSREPEVENEAGE